MLHGLISILASDLTTTLSAATCCLSSSYVHWKISGGNLLFRSKKTDDPTTSMFKAVFAFGFTYGAIIIGLTVAAVSGLICILSLLAKLFV
jgi:hypothetical protein